MRWYYLSILKLQRLHRWSLGMDKKFHPTHYNRCNYLSMLGLKLIHVSKRGHCCVFFLYSMTVKYISCTSCYRICIVIKAITTLNAVRHLLVSVGPKTIKCTPNWYRYRMAAAEKFIMPHDHESYIFIHSPTLGCNIRGLRAMGFDMRYRPRWFEYFLAIWVAVTREANGAHLGICYWPL